MLIIVIVITVEITYSSARNTFGKSVLFSSLLWQPSSFSSLLFEEASPTCFPPSSLLPFPPFLRPSLFRMSHRTWGTTGSRTKTTSSNLEPLHLSKLHPETGGDSCGQAAGLCQIQASYPAVLGPHPIFYLLLRTAASSCLPFFSLPAFLPPLSDSKKDG